MMPGDVGAHARPVPGCNRSRGDAGAVAKRRGVRRTPTRAHRVAVPGLLRAKLRHGL